MRFFKIFIVLFMLMLFARPVLSQEKQELFKKPFFRINKDLKRVGLDKTRTMVFVEFEGVQHALPPDFRLGRGDTVIVNFWGKITARYELNINKDGYILVPFIGRISIIGLTMDEAYVAIKNELEKKYTNVEFSIKLVEVENIRISVLGNVIKPGVYEVSPFCRMAETVRKAGGINDEGSLTDIRLMRGGKQVVSFNFYDYIFKGNQSKNLKLQAGDTIYVPEFKNLVAIRGDIRYPGIYEARNNSVLSKLIDTVGGMLSTKFERKISILRINPETKLTETFKELTFEPSKGIEPKDDITLKNEDTIVVATALGYTPYPQDLFKVAHISGEVKIPGDYLIKEGETLSSLIKRAGGLKDAAFAQGAIFTRSSIKQKQESILDELVSAQEKFILGEEARLAETILTKEEKKVRQKAIENRRKALNLMASRTPKGRIIIDLEQIINGKSDIVLEKGDSIYVPPILDWVIVTGCVYNPESVVFEKGKPLEYYLNVVGGPDRFADKDSIYVIKSNGCTESKATGYGKISHGDIIVVPEKIE